MTTVWYTSDLHLGHKLVSGHRGFDSPADHDEAVFTAWSARIKADDTVWVLGDLSMASSLARVTEMLAQVKKLPGKKQLILGNHDPAHPMYSDAHKFQRMYFETFESVQIAARRKLAGREVLLSHFPYTRDRGFEARHPQWRLPDLGHMLIHGHTHSSEKLLDREIHVGLDAWNLEPVDQESIIFYMNTREVMLT